MSAPAGLPELQVLEVPVHGMDCAECTQHVQRAIAALPGVSGVDVFLASEKAVIRLDPARVQLPAIRQAVAGAGYSVPAPDASGPPPANEPAGGPALGGLYRRSLTLLGVVFGAVLFVVVAGEWLGLFRSITTAVPWPIGWAIVFIAGYPIFRNVVRAAWRRQIIAHTLMSLGVLAALAVGQWGTAAVVVFFMRVGAYVESVTAERARGALRGLAALAPQMARVEQAGGEVELPIAQVPVGAVVVVRPGEIVPVDGLVLSGQATVDQAAITGEAMPAEAGPGAQVFAASLVRLGSLRLRATHVGADSTFGRVVRLVEEAEGNRAQVQRLADKFSAYYLPVVAGLAALTLLIRHDPLATAAVMVVACSCSFALATPIAMLASVGAGARQGILIKGGLVLETLARATVLLVDKTGTLTLGRPALTDIVPLNGLSASALLALAASAEKYSEHPLAEAVRRAARAEALTLLEPENFEALPGYGVRARVGGRPIAVGGGRLLAQAVPAAAGLEAQGKTLLYVLQDGHPAGLLAAADTNRPEAAQALAEARALGIRHIELLTGDNERSAQMLAEQLGIGWRANLLPPDKIAVVKDYQARGFTVVMVGDGINDAPALAQADVGIAMGAAGSAIAVEAAHLVLMRDDWLLVPEALRIARRTMRVVRLNLAFTVVYNIVGLSLAALGFLPPIFAAAAQSLPDLGILANSARLLRQRR
ncbi:MAG: cation-translocating P-type ATPase [Anaerolineales bacterium]